MKSVFFVAAISIAFASPAIARERGNFDGFKVAAVAGYDHVRVSDPDVHVSKGGLVYGATAGYDFDLGSAVIGAEVEATGSTVKISDTFEYVKAGRDLYLGARIGVPVAPTFLLYAKGGYTNARFTAGDNTFRESIDLDGFRAGAGVEYSSKTTFARLEYRYSRYNIKDSDDGKVSRNQIVVVGGMRF